MKLRKEWKFILALLTTVSVLPGCGKKADTNTNGVIGSTFGGIIGGVGATSGSLPLQANYNGGMSFAFSGNVTLTPGGNITGTGYAQSLAPGPQGYQYYRVNSAGDRIDFNVVNANGNNAVVQGVATLSATTLGAAVYYSGNSSTVQGVYFYNDTPNNYGMAGSPMYLVLGNGSTLYL